MSTAEVEEVVRVVGSCLARTRWRLRPHARRQLETDLVALYTGLRPVVMIDYGGRMPELQEHLCQLIQLAHEESSILLPLRVMVIEDMIYVIHVNGLIQHAKATTMKRPLYVDLEELPLKILSELDKNVVLEEFAQIQKQFSSITPVGVNRDLIRGDMPSLVELKTNLSEKRVDVSCNDHPSSVLMDLSSCITEVCVTIPTLTGWLLGYPVVYLFRKEHSSDAVHNLSTMSLNLYKILVTRKKSYNKQHCEELLMSFTVPYILSMRGKDEPWAIDFLTRMKDKFKRCRSAWISLHLEVEECCPRAVVL